jgi:hypothetical protein
MPKTSAKELQKRKAEARRRDAYLDHQIKPKIAEMLKQGLSTEQICDALGLSKSSPSKRFLDERLAGCLVGDYERVMHRAVVDLMRSDIPLDREARNLVATALEYFDSPEPPEMKARLRQMIWAGVAAQIKRRLEERGNTSLEAERIVAEHFGLSIDALRKRIRRARI